MTLLHPRSCFAQSIGAPVVDCSLVLIFHSSNRLLANPSILRQSLNLSLRQRFLKGNFKLLSVGPILELTVAVHSLGSNLSVLKSIAEGNNFACQDIKNADYPLLITNL